jgi:condensin complex subunit 3
LSLAEADKPKKRPLSDATSRNALNRFDTAITKKYHDALDTFDHEAYRSQERDEVRALWEFIDDV